MVKLAYIGGALVLMVAGAAGAQTKPQYSSQDIIKSFATPTGATTAQDACEAKGMLTGEDGVCEPRKNARGFSLPTRASMKSQATAPVPGAAMSTGAAPVRHVASTTTTTHAVTRTTTAAAPVAAMHRDLLITFKTGSSELTDQAQSNAKVFAQALNSPQLSTTKFEIDGHTDGVGAADKNMTLSQLRADAVKGFLVSQGVDGSRLQAKGFGFEQPAVPSNPRAAANRRVEAKRVE